MNITKNFFHDDKNITGTHKKFEKDEYNVVSGNFSISEGLIRDCNFKFAETFGYKIGEIIDRKTIEEFIFLDDKQKFEKTLSAFISSSQESTEEIIKIIKKNNSITTAKIFLSKTLSDGKPYIIGSIIEISENKTAEAPLNILAQAIDNISESLILTDLNRTIFYVNETLTRTLGFSSEELLGKNINVLLEECMDQNNLQKIINQKQKNDWQCQLIFMRKDGTHFLTILKNSLITNKKNFPIAELYTLKDISEKDRMNGELRRNAYKYRNLFEKMHEAFAFTKIVTDKENNPIDMVLLEANREFEKLIQEPAEALIGKSLLLKFDMLKNIGPDPFGVIANVALNRTEERFEVKDKSSNRWLSVSVYSPEKAFAFIIIHDITKEKKAQEESDQSKIMLKSILDNIPQRVYWKDASSTYLGCNIHFTKDVGLNDASEIIGKSEYDFSPSELAESYIANDKFIIESGESVNCLEYLYQLPKDKNKIWIRLNKMPLKNFEGKIIGVVGTYEDISKQKSIEDNLRKLSQAVEQSPASIVITDTSGNIEYINQKFSLVTGYSFQEVFGKNPRILKSGETSTEAYKEMWKTISSGKEWEGEFHNKKKNAELYWERATISPIKDNDGVITHYLAIKEDITARKQSEKVLKENEKILRETQTIARLGSYVFDIHKNIWYSSTILDNIFGIDEKFTRSLDGWISLLHPDWRETMNNYFSKKVLEEHARFDKEYKIIRKSDGEERWVHGLGEVEYDSNNQPVKMIGTISDITERKHAEEALKHSFSLLEGTLESTVDGILVVDQNGNIQKFNNKFLDLWRIPESIIQTRNDDAALNFVLDQLKYPDQFLNKVKELYKDTVAESLDLLEFKDGRVFERYSRPQLIGNKVVGRVWSFRDITDRKIAEESLIESEDKFRTLFETSIEGILVADINEKSSLVNKRMAEMTGYSVDELMNMNFHQLISPDELGNHFLRIESRKKGDSEIYERKLVRKDGSIIWTLVSAAPILNKEGKYTGSFGVFTDITERKKMVEELIVAKEKAEEANRLKSIFLANISHELRTPLVGIIGYAETLYNEIENPEFKDMAYTLFRSGTRLKETLNLILDLSHIEADKLEVNIARQNLTIVVREKFKQFHSVAMEKGLKFQLVLGEDDLVINADERMLSQVIEHLLANAIKYTNKGNIIVTISKITENQKQFAQMKVKDTGIGIPRQSSRLIFEPFRQASEGFSRSFEGLGIGLTVAKKFIEMMGGEIAVESDVGKGSEFIVKFPICSHDDLEFPKDFSYEKLLDEQIIHNYKYSSEVLLIEDDEATANIVRFYLGEICKTDWAYNAKTAISMAENKNYSAILADINLGIGMDGIEAVNHIKKIKGYKSIPIIAVTAYALYGDREKFLKLGCTHYISKPFGKNDIVALVDKVLGSQL